MTLFCASIWPDHRRPGPLPANQLLFQQRQRLGDTDQDPVKGPARHLAGRDESHRIECLVVARQVFLKPLGREKGIAAGGHLHLAFKAGCQGTKAVVEHQHARRGARLLLRQVAKQVLVGSIEGLQRIIVLFWLADQIELGEGAFEQGHGGEALNYWLVLWTSSRN